MSSTAPEVVVDAAAREAAVDTPGSVLVQAPAGSGKTTLLVQRYLHLLGRVDAPERILALTFTRRAAQEMRERVLNALAAARDPPAPDVPPDRTRELAQQALTRLAAAGIDLQSAPTRMRIETIDAFNAWLAGQMPIAAGAAAGLEILQNPRTAYDEAARRALAYEADDSFGAAVERVLKLDDQRWRSLVRLVAGMLSTRDRWLPLLAGGLRAAEALDVTQQQALRGHFDEDLALLIERRLRAAAEYLGAQLLTAVSPLMVRAALRLGAADADQQAWRAPSRTLTPMAADTARWRALAALLLTKDGGVRSALNKTVGFPPGCADKQPMTDVLAEVGRRGAATLSALREVRGLPDPRYSDAQWGQARDVAQLLVLAAAELEAVFRERGAIDFTAVSLAALRALGGPEAPTDLALRLDYRLQHILVDEFQDTSSAQLSLVALLTQGWQEGDGRSIFCVGDPMQSIYGFRQAEVRAFLELADQGIGGVRFAVQRLQSNFRSARGVVEWNNQTFRHILPAHDDKQRGAIAFRPSVARDQAFSGEVDCCGFDGRASEAHAVAAAVAAQLRRHPDSRIAILVRARTHAREVAAALRGRALVARSRDIEALQDYAVVRDILMLTRVLLHAGDRVAWLAVLRAPWAALRLADLLVLSQVRLPFEALHDAAVLAQLSEAGRDACQRIGAALEAAYSARAQMPLARLVESLWLTLGGAACLAEQQALSHANAAFRRLRDMEQQGLPDPAEIQTGFEDLFADEGGEDAQVEIMTIHKAKGLEFDMVIVPGLERAVPPLADALLLAHSFSRMERDGMVIAARSPVGADRDRLFSFLKTQQRDAAALEAQRLLYVACTRAKHRMLLTADVSMPEPAGEDAVARLFRPPPASLLAALWPTLAEEFALPPATPRPAPAAMPEGPRGGALSRLPAGWERPRSADIAGGLVAPTLEREPWPEFDWAGETARRVGSLVHAELQTLDLARVEEGALRARSAYFRRWLAAHGVPEGRLVDAAERSVGALLAVRDDPRGQWILRRGYEDDFREHALSGEFQGQTLRAVFDRSFVDQGIRWVIDYKTSQHGGGGREEFLDREVLRYKPQLERYARLASRLGPQPVRVGLYFPLMRAWREWAPGAIDGQLELDI